VSGHSRRQGKEKMKKYPVTAIVVLLLVAVSSPPTPASLADGRDDSAQKLQRLDSFLAGVDRIEGLIDRSSFDVAAIAKKNNYDVDDLFALVRDKMGFQAYQGVLRGALGTLLEGAGNSLDQALLLSSLLQAGGGKRECRFVSGTLSARKAAELVQSMFRQRDQSGTPSLELPPLPDTLRELGISQPEFERRIAEAESAGDAFLEEVRKNVDAELRSVVHLLSERKTKLSTDPENDLSQLVAAARNHFWIQINDGKGWTDLDPCFPDSKPGRTYCAPEKTWDNLDAECHRLGVKLTLEQLAGGRLRIQTLYQNSRPLADLQGKTVSLTIFPEGLDLSGLQASSAAGDIAKRIDSLARFQPVVDFGAEREYGRPFDLQGNHYIFQAGSYQAAAEEGFAGLGRRMRTLRPGTKDQETQLAALRLEISLTAPGGAERLFSRDLVDRLDTAGRAAGKFAISSEWQDFERLRMALFLNFSLLPVCSRFNEDFALSRAFQFLFEKRELLREAVRLDSGETPTPFSELSGQLDLFPFHLLALTLLESSGLTEILPGQACGYYAHPALYGFEESLDLSAQGQVVYRSGYDLMAHGIRIALPRGKEADVSSALLSHGLLLSNLESELLKEMNDGIQPLSTQAVMKSAANLGTSLLLLQPGEQEKLSTLKIKEKAKALVRKDMESGFLVILPESEVPVEGRPAAAWWRLDPGMSSLIGVTETGRNQALMEMNMIINKFSIPAAKNCMKYVACLMGAIGGGATLNQMGAKCMAQFLKNTMKNNIKIIRGKVYGKILKTAGFSLGTKVKLLMTIGWKINDDFL
jgi:hypothetical protein